VKDLDLPPIPVARPHMPRAKDLIPYLERLDETYRYSNFGPLVTELEMRLIEYLDDDGLSLSTCNSATTGIQGLIETSAEGTGGAWTLPSWTFSATTAAVIGSRSVPNFTDVNEHDMWLSNHDDSKNLIAVAPFGDSPVTGFAIPSKSIIIDAAASFDSLTKIKWPSGFDWAVVVSLHATKTLGAGEGGFVFSRNSQWIKSFREWTNFGFDAFRVSGSLGSNSKMSEYHAAVALASLDMWPETKESLLELAQIEKGISESFGRKTGRATVNGWASPYWILECNSSDELRSVMDALSREKIEFRKWWADGCHKMPAYDKVKTVGNLQVTDSLASRTIGLPHFVGLQKSSLERISRVLEIALLD
jgi:dTDP-4-amino-4,6-dideoxygalactose transaminase